MWFYFVKCLLFILVLLSSFSLSAQTIQVLTTEEPPLSFELNGVATGFSTDIVNEIMARNQSLYPVEVLPWARAYKKVLTEKNTAAFTMARTPSRERHFHWIGPLVQKKWVLYRHKNNEMTISDLLDARKKSIVVVQKDARAAYLKEKGFENIYEVSDHTIALNMLMKGRVDLWITSDFEGPALVEDSGFKMSLIENAYTVKIIESYIGFSKNTSLKIVKQWRDAFTDMKQDGTLKMIAAKWSKITGIEMSAENGVLSYK